MRYLVLASTALLASTAASAQVYCPPPTSARLPGIATNASPGTGRETTAIRRDVKHGREAGTLTRVEARSLRREANQIDTLADRYGADGLSDSEARELDSRARVLRDITTAQRTASAGKKR